MTEILISALSTAFFLVRLVKGPWMRNPQYVAAATIGAVAISLMVNSLLPSFENNMITESLTGAGGAWGGILAFDLLLAG